MLDLKCVEHLKHRRLRRTRFQKESGPGGKGA